MNIYEIVIKIVEDSNNSQMFSPDAAYNQNQTYLYIQRIKKLSLYNLVFVNGSSRPWPFFLKLRPYIFFFGGLLRASDKSGWIYLLTYLRCQSME